MQRRYYLDNLKLFLTLLVVFHHAAQPHLAGSYWPYHFAQESMIIPGIWRFTSTNASFFMGLFFLIAGYFVPRSYDKQKAKTFVLKKIIHLGVPCAIMTTLISCLMVHHFEIAHMWFLENLLFFSLLYALYRLIGKPLSNVRQRGASIWQMLCVELLMGVVVHTVRQFYAQDEWIGLGGILFFEPARYGQYIIMFIVGIISYRFDTLERMSRITGLACLITGIMLIVLNCTRFGITAHLINRYYGFMESLMSITISFGLIWLFREYFNRTNRLVSWCCSQTLWVYVVHLPLMVCIQFAFDGMSMPPVPRLLFIGVVSTIISFFTAGLISWTIEHIRNSS